MNGTSTFAKSCVSNCYQSSTGDLRYGISTTCCTEDLCNGQTVENPIIVNKPKDEKVVVNNLSSLKCYTCSNCGQNSIGIPLECPSSQYYCSV